MTSELVTLVGSAFLMGLAGSGHCLSMCGGIAGALGVRSGAGGASPNVAAVLHSLGRITVYMILGAVLGSVGALADVALSAAPVLRALSAVIVILVGLQLVGIGRGMAWVERAGLPLWRVASRGIGRIGSADRAWKALALGGLWGLLPCGLVYAAAATAAATGSVRLGLVFMGSFGLGTLPSMVIASGAAGRVGASSIGPRMRRFAGGALIALGLVAIVGAVAPRGGHEGMHAPAEAHHDAGAEHPNAMH